MSDPSQDQKNPNQYNGYLKYSGLAIQLLVAIGFFGWLGYLLDHYMEIKFPAFMLLFGFLAFGGMMLQIYRSINREN
jgi:F0F1-type ATP synthase assembly protein I